MTGLNEGPDEKPLKTGNKWIGQNIFQEQFNGEPPLTTAAQSSQTPGSVGISFPWLAR